jgi:hypothetical protein
MNSAILDIPDRVAILCIGYSHGDMQFGVTGSCLVNERVQLAAIREVTEELGISFKHSELRIHSSGSTIDNPNVESTIFSLDMDTCQPTAISNEHKKIINSSSDDKTRKVAVVVYGSKSTITRVMEMARPQKREEQISYYASVPKDKAVDIISVLKDKKNKDGKRGMRIADSSSFYEKKKARYNDKEEDEDN